MYGSFLVADADGCREEFTKIQVRLNSALAQGPCVLVAEKKGEAVEKGSLSREREICVHGWIVSGTYMYVITYILCIRGCTCTVVAVEQTDTARTSGAERGHEADYV
jgi:hypothetical protein